MGPETGSWELGGWGAQLGANGGVHEETEKGGKRDSKDRSCC